MNCFFAKGNQNTDEVRSTPLFVNNCGYYRSLDTPIHIHRANGRADYQLLLCFCGEISVGGKQLGRGDAYLFSPRQKQIYTYHPMPDSFYGWIHFTGTEIESLLSLAGLDEGRIRCDARLNELETLFRLLSSLLSEGLPNADALAAGLLSSILLLLPSAKLPSSPFSAAIKQLDELGTPVNVGELAALYGMSNAHFIRSFRAYFGTTPYHYRKLRQMELARLLLSESSLGVAQIALRVGIDDPLYFSRTFRKHVGKTPLEYRKASQGL